MAGIAAIPSTAARAATPRTPAPHLTTPPCNDCYLHGSLAPARLPLRAEGVAQTGCRPAG